MRAVVLLTMSGLLVLGIAPLSYEYYGFLRLFVTATAAYFAWYCHNRSEKFDRWTIAFVAVALLFNPIIAIHLNKAIWVLLDASTACMFVNYWYRNKSSLWI